MPPRAGACTVIKDGETIDRDYHPRYKGWIFANARDDEGEPVVEKANTAHLLVPIRVHHGVVAQQVLARN